MKGPSAAGRATSPDREFGAPVLRFGGAAGVIAAVAVVFVLLLSGVSVPLGGTHSASIPSAGALRSTSEIAPAIHRPLGAGPVVPLRAGTPLLRSFSAPSPTGGTGDALLASSNLLNGTFAPGYRTAPQGLAPEGIAYDAGKAEIFVADSQSNKVSVYDNTMSQLLATIAVGTRPVAVVYDPVGSEVFVANSGSNNVTVINDSRLAVISNISVGAQSGYFASAPSALAYASVGGDIFVAEVGAYISPCCTYNVTEIDGRSNAIVRVIHVGAGPFAEAYYPASNLVYVLNYEGYSMSIINAATGGIVGTYGLAGLPAELAVDTSDGVLGVVQWNGYNLNLSEYSLPGSSITLTRVVAIPGYQSFWGTMVYDPSANAFLVAESGSSFGGVTALTGAYTLYSHIGVCLSGVTYSATGPTLLAADYCANRAFALNPVSVQPLNGIRTGYDPTAVAYNPGNGDLYVADGSGDSVAMVNATTLQLAGRVVVGIGPSSFAHDPVVGATYVLCDNGFGNATVEVVSDATGTVAASIHMPQPQYSASADTVAFDSFTSRVYVVGPTTGLYGYTNESLTVIDPALNRVVANETVTVYAGGTLGGGYYDRATLVPLSATTAAVSDPWEGRVFGMNVLNGTRVWTSVVGGTPTYMSLDPLSGDLDVAISNTAKIALVDPTTGASAGTIGLQHPAYSFAFDPANGRLYATEPGASVAYIESLGDPSGLPDFITIVPASPDEAVYLPGSGVMAFSAPSTSSVYFLGAAMTAQVPVVAPTPQVQAEPFTVTNSVADGFAPYTYHYSGLPSGCASANVSLLTCDPSVAGNYTISVRVTDLASETSVVAVLVHVGAYPLNVSIVIAPTSLAPKNGTVVAATASLPGSESTLIGPYVNFTWKVAPVWAATINVSKGPWVGVTFVNATAVTLTLTSDFNGTTNVSTVTFHVVASTAPGTGSGKPTLSGTKWTSDGLAIYVLLLGAALVVVAALSLRRPRPPAPPPPEAEPEPAEPPAESPAEDPPAES